MENLIKLESGIRIKIVDKIEAINPKDWFSVFPKVLENYYFFKTLDEANFLEFKFFYILVFKENIPIAATSCFLMRFPFDSTVDGKLKKVLGFVKKILPNIFSPKVLICGLPMGQGRIGFIDKVETIMPAIYQGMETIAKAEKVSLLIFKDFINDKEEIFKPLKGFLKLETLPSTIMDINFIDFNDYLNSLSLVSKEGLKRKLKKVDREVNIDLEITNILEEDILRQVYSLYLQTFNKMDLSLEKLTLDFFRQISINMPEEVKYFLWRIEGKLVAFALCLVDNDYFIDYYLGFDYSLAYQYHLYFIRFRDLMKFCISKGIKKYEMGVTSYEPKRRLGFDFLRFYFYIKHRNKLLNPFVKIVANIIKPENFDPVFKMMKEKKVEHPLKVSQEISA